MRTRILIVTALTLVGCGESQMVLLERTVTPMDGAGGEAVSADGRLRLTFAPDTLSSPTEVTITTRRDLDRSALLALIYEVQTDASPLMRPVEMRLGLPDARADQNPVLVRLERGMPIVAEGSTFDPLEQVVVASVDHFSLWSAASGTTTADAGFGLSDGGPPEVGPVADAGPMSGDAGPGQDGGLLPDSGSRPDGSAMDAGTSTVPPAIVTAELPDVARCAPYVARLEAASPTGRLTWRVVSGALPPGIALDSDGRMYGGSGERSGAYTVTVEVADALGLTDSRAFTIQVNASVGGVRWVAMTGSIQTSTRTDVWVVNVCDTTTTPTPIRVTPSAGFVVNGQGSGIPFDHDQIAFAPDGRALAYFGSNNPQPVAPAYLVYLVDLRGVVPGASIAVPNRPGSFRTAESISTLKWSPGSSKLAWQSTTLPASVVDTTNPAAPSGPVSLHGFEFLDTTLLRGRWSFSPDDRKLAFKAPGGGPHHQVADVSQVAAGVVTGAILDPTAIQHSETLSWSPTSSGVVQASARLTPPNGDWESGLYWTPTGTFPLPAPTRLTTIQTFGLACKWSNELDAHLFGFTADGRRVFGVCGADANRTLYVGTTSAGVPGPLQAVAGADDVQYLRWSPDGDRVLFSSTQAGALALFVADVSVTPPRVERVGPVAGSGRTLGSNRFHAFQWSYDGEQVAYVTTDAGGDRLFVADMTAAVPSSVQVNTPVAGARIKGAQFSPDGRRIAALTDYGTAGHHLHVAELASSTRGAWTLVHPMPTSSADDVADPDPSLDHYYWFWTSDGRKLIVEGAFATPDVDEIWLIDVSGTAPFSRTRISPSGAAVGRQIIRAWADGPYAKDVFLRP